MVDGRLTTDHGSELALEALKAIRDACVGMTQIEIEQHTGVSASAMSRILNGNRVPTLATLEAILDGLGYDVTLRVRRREQ